MTKTRLEAFSDGVLAIIITIMVLEMKVPHGTSYEDLLPIVPVFLGYVLSFIYIGIYWNNHHHLLHTVDHVNGAIMWSNLHLLFWLSLFPFVSGWMGENHFAAAPSALYGFVLLMASVSWTLLQNAIIKTHGTHSLLANAVGDDRKGKLSTLLYAMAIPLAFWQSWLAQILYIAVALIWLVPDRRITRVLDENH
jgi:uncharacterized membrane protein